MNHIDSAHEAEFKQCAEDFFYFCENYVKVIHPKLGLVPFKLHEFQKRYVNDISTHRFVIGTKFRQGGFSTTTLAWLTWRLLFKLDERSMAMSKTDREALYNSKIVRVILDQLPDWIQPEYGKRNDHMIENVGTGSSLCFYTPQAARGRALNYLFVDEPAFIQDMDIHWKAMWPTLSTGGHCIAMSTTNGVGNWFEETYHDAADGKNNFHVYTCSYTEHPEYNNEAWVAEVRKNLGEKGWQQEVLCNFLVALPPEPPKEEPVKEEPSKKPELPPDQYFFEVKSLVEEAEILHKCRKRAYEQGKGNQCQFGNIKENKTPIKLSYDDTEKECGVSFDNVSRPQTFFGYYWPDVAEDIAEEHIFVNEDYSLFNSIEKKKDNLRDLETRVNEVVYSDDLLKLAGVIDEVESTEDDRHVISGNTNVEVLKRVKELGNFPENLKISFSEKKLCVNNVPTNVGEFELCCLYSGLLAFTSHDKAVNKVAKLICKKLQPLFGTKGGK
jgi:hypothetical protein